eukprot:SAG11_NODE_2567_length_3215_cov_2.528562_1_plen_229_part_00
MLVWFSPPVGSSARCLCLCRALKRAALAARSTCTTSRTISATGLTARCLAATTTVAVRHQRLKRPSTIMHRPLLSVLLLKMTGDVRVHGAKYLSELSFVFGNEWPPLIHAFTPSDKYPTAHAHPESKSPDARKVCRWASRQRWQAPQINSVDSHVYLSACCRAESYTCRSAARRVAANFGRYWANLARHGSPNVPGGGQQPPHWPAWEPLVEPHLEMVVRRTTHRQYT